MNTDQVNDRSDEAAEQVKKSTGKAVGAGKRVPGAEMQETRDTVPATVEDMMEDIKNSL
jgi:DNA-binding ferritin-like protein